MNKPVRHTFSPDMIAYGKLVRLLMEGTRSIKELAEEVGLNVNTVSRYCGALYHADAIFISNWRLDAAGRYSIRIYKVGTEGDLKPPVRTKKLKAVLQRARRAAVAEGLPYHDRAHKRELAYGD